MDKSTAEEFQRKGLPVWLLGVWSAMPVKARIVKICDDESSGMYAEVDFICDRKLVNSGNQDVCIGDMFASKEDLIAAMFEDMLKKTVEIEAAIQTKDDCIQFMFMHTVSCAGEYTDWTARRAIQKIAKERWDLDLM